jgi:carboxyl-terminal processing protease
MGGSALLTRSSWQRGLLVLALGVVVSLSLSSFSPRASGAAGVNRTLLWQQAQQFEKDGDWAQAAQKFEALLKLDRTQAGIRERLGQALRRHYQIVRLRDSSYHKDVLSLKYGQAMRMYEMVLFNLLSNSLDRDKVSGGVLFHKGCEEFINALSASEFWFDHLAGLKPAHARPLQAQLRQDYAGRPNLTFEEAVEAVRDVVLKSTNHFPTINPTAVVMEFLCGACQALDEYTVYLTPRQLRELCDTLKGQTVGIGVRLRMAQHRLVIGDVLADSPAAEMVPPLARSDQIIRINNQPTAAMPLEAAQESLEGEAGTSVTLEVESMPSGARRIVVLRRRPCFVPSVQHDLVGQVGYLKIHCFQETTLQEFDTHLAELVKADCKGLILDLRGNPGGLLDVSIEIARRLLPSGVIVRTQHNDPKASMTYRANNPTALGWPLVVLVDGDTASAAEVLAGALKENHRARVMGQTTFGKGCSQGILKLPGEGALRSPATPSAMGTTGGIRITVARFFSPTDQPYTGRGVEPDVTTEGEFEIYRARDEVLGLLKSPMVQ